MEEYRKPALRLAVADGNLSQLRIIRDYSHHWEEIESVDAFVSAQQLLNMLAAGKEYDVIVLDTNVQGEPVSLVLQRLNAMNLARRPAVIVTTSVQCNGVTGLMERSGAQMVIRKPYQLEKLFESILALGMEQDEYDAQRCRSRIRWHLAELRLTADDSGYWYLLHTLEYVVSAHQECAFSKEVYPYISRMHGVSANAVDSGIRRAIATAQQRSPEECHILRERIGLKEEDSFSNTKFVFAIAHQIWTELAPEWTQVRKERKLQTV